MRFAALEVLEALCCPVDADYLDASRQAVELVRQLSVDEPPELSEDEMLTAPLDAVVRALPLPLAVDAARQIAQGDLTRGLAVLRTVRPNVEAADLPALVDGLAAIPLTGSAMMLMDILSDSPPKALQKTIKKALHRLKSGGVIFSDDQAPRQVVLGGAVSRLERCLASFIDGSGDRKILMIRTRPAGGYQIAYLVLNYGTGIRFAKALQVSRRELPELLESVQAQAPLIELEPAHCHRQIALVQQMNLATRTPVPEEFFMLRDLIGEPDAMPEAGAIYEALSPQELEMARAQNDHAEDLLELPELGGWTLPESVVQGYADALAEIDESKIVVSETMQRERVGSRLRECHAGCAGGRIARHHAFTVGGNGPLFLAHGGGGWRPCGHWERRSRCSMTTRTACASIPLPAPLLERQPGRRQEAARKPYRDAVFHTVCRRAA